MREDNREYYKKGPLVVMSAIIGASVASAMMAVLSDSSKRKKILRVVKKTVAVGKKNLDKVKSTLDELSDMDEIREDIADISKGVKKTIKRAADA